MDNFGYYEIYEGVDYTFDPAIGEITMLAPMPVGASLYCYYNYSAREFFGVEYNINASKFGLVGTNPDPVQNTCLYTNPGDGQLYEVSRTGNWPMGELRDIDVDCWGNMVAVGPLDEVFFFRLSDDTWYTINDKDDSGWDYYSVDFELENKRFYIVGGSGDGAGCS